MYQQTYRKDSDFWIPINSEHGKLLNDYKINVMGCPNQRKKITSVLYMILDNFPISDVLL